MCVYTHVFIFTRVSNREEVLEYWAIVPGDPLPRRIHVRMNVWLCVVVYVHTHIYIYIYAYTISVGSLGHHTSGLIRCTHICMYAWVCIYTHIYMYTCMSQSYGRTHRCLIVRSSYWRRPRICTYACMHGCICIYTLEYTHMFVCIVVFVRTHFFLSFTCSHIYMHVTCTRTGVES